MLTRSSARTALIVCVLGTALACGRTELGKPGLLGGPVAGTGGAPIGPDPVPLAPVERPPADKIDLLFVIDNSSSMADKQELFQSALPLLVERFISPVCVDATNTPTGALAAPDGTCSEGQAEFPPIRDIHLGVITSSLGTNGADVCGDTGVAESNDRAWLLPSVRADLRSWDSSGFLAWDPAGDRNVPSGEASVPALVADFAEMVGAVGETGCGYEATLEAWYRFLIDPEPPSLVTADPVTLQTSVFAPDALILEQRARFLRPDSVVGIVVLSDENDCSIRADGNSPVVATARYAGREFRMPRATSACAADANDPCCTSCNAAPDSIPRRCPGASDPECRKPEFAPHEDHPNLRCFQQKRRFGIDFLYPIQRYVEGLTSVRVTNRAGKAVQNPLFAGRGLGRRELSRVFLVGIVGVPWQDVADEPSLTHPTRLRYLTARELTEADRWSLLLGSNGAPPRDAFMLETPQDRSTLALPPHPLLGTAVTPSSATAAEHNPINGHESRNVDSAELQYACTFPLVRPRECTLEAAACDCKASDLVYERSLCQAFPGGPFETTQYSAKAFPGLRHLELLREVGRITGNAVVASICPKVVDTQVAATTAEYGYNPAVAAMIDRMKVELAPACLPDALPLTPNGQVACRAFEVADAALGCEPCSGAGRVPVEVEARRGLNQQLLASHYCGQVGQSPCEELCVCEVTQHAAADLELCRSEPELPIDLRGFCYVDAEQNLGDASLVQYCPPGRKRRLRVTGENLPRPGAKVFLVCADG